MVSSTRLWLFSARKITALLSLLFVTGIKKFSTAARFSCIKSDTWMEYQQEGSRPLKSLIKKNRQIIRRKLKINVGGNGVIYFSPRVCECELSETLVVW